MESIINSNILKYGVEQIHTRQAVRFRHDKSTTNLVTPVTHPWSASLEFHGESKLMPTTFQKRSIEYFLHKLSCHGILLKLDHCQVSPPPT